MIPPDRGGDAPPPAEAPAPDEPSELEAAADAPVPDDAGPASPAPRAGTSTFTIEGRAAPALFVVGWLASLMGLGLLVVSFQSTGPPQLVLLLVGLVLLSIGLVAGAGSQGIERRARGVAPYQGPSPLIVFAAVIPITSLAIVVAAAPVSFLGFDVDTPPFRLLSVVVQAFLYLALIRLLVVDTGALSWAEMGIRRPEGSSIGRELAAGAVWALPVIAITVPISALLVGWFDAAPPSPLPPTGENAGFALQLAAGALIAPLGEELFFRAFATTAWARSLGTGTAIVRGGLFFAFVHVLTIAGTSLGEAAALALIGFATRVPIGLVLGWLFVRRGTIWAPIGLHATFNGLLLVAAEAAIRSGAAS